MVILPIFFAMRSVNHSAPSGPTAMPYGSLSAVGTANSVIAPLTVIRPILLPEAADSVNHRAPSGPAVMNSGPAPAARGYSVKIPAGEILPILLPASSVNQIAPSGPAAMPWGWPPGVGMEYSERAPAVVMRPILQEDWVNAGGGSCSTGLPRNTRFYTLRPCRLIDTRSPSAPLGGEPECAVGARGDPGRPVVGRRQGVFEDPDAPGRPAAPQEEKDAGKYEAAIAAHDVLLRSILGQTRLGGSGGHAGATPAPPAEAGDARRWRRRSQAGRRPGAARGPGDDRVAARCAARRRLAGYWK